MLTFHNRVETSDRRVNGTRQKFAKITIKELLTILIGTAIPVSIGVYTAVNNEQVRRLAKLAAEEQHRIATERREFDLARAKERYQQQLYSNFLDNMYLLHKAGELNQSATPWAFANARYRAAHHEFDEIRKVQALQFLKERKLIGCRFCTGPCLLENVTSIVHMDGLNFDNLIISSGVGSVQKLDLTCIEFSRVSMVNVSFSNVNLNGAIFNNSQLNLTQFHESSLNCVIIESTGLDGTNFSSSKLKAIQFINVDDSKAIFMDGQKQQVIFNKSATKTTTTKSTPLKDDIFIDIPANASWQRNGVTVAGGNASGSGLNRLSDPHGLCIDDNQTVYIADLGNHRVVEWKVNATGGRVVAGGNGSGNGIHQLSSPIDVIIDKETESLIICDRGNRRVVRWPRQYGTRGEIIISNVDCYGLSMDRNGSTYVVDNGQATVRRYDKGESVGILIAGGNGNGNRSDQFSSPEFISVDQNHSVYVSDRGNGRVMKWMQGAKEGVVVASKQVSGNGLVGLDGPQGIFVDRLGTVYVADCGNSRIIRWLKGSTNGSVIADKNGAGAPSNQLNCPEGLSFDRYGNMYVVDWGNHRVQRFDIIH